MTDSSRSVKKEVTISLIVTASLIGILLVATASVLIYYRRQTRRTGPPRRNARSTTGYRTGLNSDKLKKQASATLKGSDVMKEPVNWSNAGPPVSAAGGSNKLPQHRRSRSFDLAVVDIGDLEAAAALPPASVPDAAVAVNMTSTNHHQHQLPHQSRLQQRQLLRRCNSWSLSESRRGITE